MTARPPALLTFLGFAATAGCQGRDTLRNILCKAQAYPDRGADLCAPRDAALQPRRHAPCLVCTLRAGMAELQRRFSGQALPREPGAISAVQLRHVLGARVFDELASKTGLTEPDLLARLARGLPVTVALMETGGVLPIVAQPQPAAENRC